MTEMEVRRVMLLAASSHPTTAEVFTVQTGLFGCPMQSLDELEQYLRDVMCGEWGVTLDTLSFLNYSNGKLLDHLAPVHHVYPLDRVSR